MRFFKDGRRVFAAVCILSLAGALLPGAYDAAGSAGEVMYVLHPYLWVLPLCVAGPFLSALGGIAPLIAFFPPGLCFLLCPYYPGAAGTALLFLLLSLFSAEAGREAAKRIDRKKGARDGAVNGKKARRR